MQQTLTEDEIREITGYQKPKFQADKLREFGYIVLGFSARGRVRALADHPAQAKVSGRDKIRLNL